MKLLIILSVIACSYAAKLDRTYLPPASASSAGGSPGSLTAPGFPGAPGNTGFGPSAGAPASSGFGQQPGAPGASGSGQFSGAPISSEPAYGQQSGFEPSGQTGSSPAFGSNAGSSAGPQTYSQGQISQAIGQGPSSFGQIQEQPERPRASLDRNAEILRYDNQNDGETFAYSFETSNGISAEESGVATNGFQAQGGYAYTGDDGQEYRVTYTADENGYQPQGDHLPTPHPIPEEILRSIEQNARAAAAGNQEGAYNPDENDSELGLQQYGAVPSYQGQSQAGPSYQSQSSQGPSYQQASQGPTQQYGAPSAALSGQYNQQHLGPTSGPQGPTQQYGTPSVAPSSPARSPSGQYNQQSFGSTQGPQGPAQQYGTTSAAPSSPARSPSGQYNQQSFGSTQGPQGSTQQYGAPSAAPSGPARSPSGQYNQQSFGLTQGPQGPAQQYGTPSAAPSGPARSSSGQYNQQKFGSTQGTPGQFGLNRPQEQEQGPSGYQYNRPQAPAFSRDANQGSPRQSSGSQIPGVAGLNGKGSISSTGPFGPASRLKSGSNNQGAFGPASVPRNQGAFGPTSGPRNQGAFGPASEPRNEGNFGPTSGTNNQGAFGPASRLGNQGSTSQYQPGQSRPRTSMPQSAPYQYDRPSAFLQTGSSAGQPGLGAQPGQRTSGQNFGGPRQPPSFSTEEGYKY